MSQFRRAKTEDIKALQELYFAVYGSTYPLPLGQDPVVMRGILTNEENQWYVVDGEHGKLISSCIFEVEPVYQISRVSGLVVHPAYRGRNIAQHLLHSGLEELFSSKEIRTVYATTRTVSLPPQVTFLKEAFLPLGISPNAHRLESFETLTLMATYNKNISFERNKSISLPYELKALVEITQKNFPSWFKDSVSYYEKPKEPREKKETLGFEIIYAPNFVYERFKNTFQDPWERFYPFHKPNLLISSVDQKIEIFAYFSPIDGYCTIITYNTDLASLDGRINDLFRQLKKYGVSYIEILVQLNDTETLDGLLQSRFLPSGIYPGMVNLAGVESDIVLMSRSMEPLDFHSMKLADCFKPFLDQYVTLWKKKFLDSLQLAHF